MELQVTFVISLILVLVIRTTSQQHPVIIGTQDDTSVWRFVDKAEEVLRTIASKRAYLAWDYQSNLTAFNKDKYIEYMKQTSAVRVLEYGLQAKKIDLEKVTDYDHRRKIKKLIAEISTSILPKEKLDRYIDITNEMSSIYGKAKIKNWTNRSQLMSLEPDVYDVMANSRNPAELEYYWNEWRNATGSQMRGMYLEFIHLKNEAARLNGYRDAADEMVHDYESDVFHDEMAKTWHGLKPLYEQLHAYVRHRLWQRYGSDVIDLKGPIPSHLLGNMWAQSWDKISGLLRPYSDKPNIDVSDAMKANGWTVSHMFRKGEEFFTSMGLPPMRQEFWNRSIITKPDDGRDIVCHASAWDFANGRDFRIKQCTQVNQADFVTVSHEMGHTEYQMLYSAQPYLYQGGANPGFHEGVGDTISLAVGTAAYYKRLGLLSDDVDASDLETDTNILMDMALRRLVFMPFGYLVDKYRWDLFSGWASPGSNLNCHWHKLRYLIQGVAPPSKRSGSHLFDAGSKYHIAANVGYVRYFTAHVYQFQFYKALCSAAGQYDEADKKRLPLHRCNFYGSRAAGDLLKSMLKMGASRPWKEAMEAITGQREMDTGPFREYFAPLETWLKEYNSKNGVHVGWDSNWDDVCSEDDVETSSTTTTISSSLFFNLVVMGITIVGALLVQ